MVRGVYRHRFRGTSALGLINVVSSASCALPLIPRFQTYCCDALSDAMGQERPPTLRKNNKPFSPAAHREVGHSSTRMLRMLMTPNWTVRVFATLGVFEGGPGTCCP